MKDLTKGIVDVKESPLYIYLLPCTVTGSRQFVLQLWQHLHTSRLQREHGLPDSSLQDLRPLYLTAGTTRSGGARVSEKINVG